jgi:hypothetical protein
MAYQVVDFGPSRKEGAEEGYRSGRPGAQSSGGSTFALRSHLRYIAGPGLAVTDANLSTHKLTQLSPGDRCQLSAQKPCDCQFRCPARPYQ